MFPRRRRDDPHLLVVGMTGVRMGDRVAQVGCAHGGRLAAVASKVGLSGRAVAFVPDQAAAARARKAVEDAGVLVEIEIAPPDVLFVIPLRSSVAVELFRLIPPDTAGTPPPPRMFCAEKPVTVFAPGKVVPWTEEVDSVVPLITPPAA